MSKKYVPSFLKQGESPTTFPEFPMNRKPKQGQVDVAFDAFPMNKRSSQTPNASQSSDFDAFRTVKRLSDVDAFSMSASTKQTSHLDAYSAFSKTKKTAESSDGFPMNKRSSSENRPPLEPRSSHLVFEPMTYGGILVTPSVPNKARSVVVVCGQHKPVHDSQDEEEGSFATKFANKMKLADDPLTTVVDMESEQDFPTLGVVAKPSSATRAKTWNLSTDHLEQSIQKVNVRAPLPSNPVKKTPPKKSVPATTSTIVPVIAPRRILSALEETKEDDFQPIEYEEDAFEEDEELLASDVDEEALFADDDNDEEDDELDPALSENRRHPEDLY